MDNKLRIKRVKAGIKLLEKGIDPAIEWKLYCRQFADYLGLSELGASILYANGRPEYEGIMQDNGFFYSYHGRCLLHNWRRFLELIENLK